MRRSLFAFIFSSLIALPAVATETVNAVWRQQEVVFTYLGLEAAYSCDLMEARIEMMLRQVGTADLDVTTSPCPGYDHPQMRLPIRARFSTLVPAGNDDADVVKASWSEVELGKWHPRSIDDRDCELLEHFQRHILPTIGHEVIEGKTGCGATRRTIVGRLKLKVLKPVAGEKDE